MASTRPDRPVHTRPGCPGCSASDTSVSIVSPTGVLDRHIAGASAHRRRWVLLTLSVAQPITAKSKADLRGAGLREYCLGEPGRTFGSMKGGVGGPRWHRRRLRCRFDGYNRVIKQIKRVSCGFRNQQNYERRLMLHSAAHPAA